MVALARSQDINREACVIQAANEQERKAKRDLINQTNQIMLGVGILRLLCVVPASLWPPPPPYCAGSRQPLGALQIHGDARGAGAHSREDSEVFRDAFARSDVLHAAGRAEAGVATGLSCYRFGSCSESQLLLWCRDRLLLKTQQLTKSGAALVAMTPE